MHRPAVSFVRLVPVLAALWISVAIAQDTHDVAKPSVDKDAPKAIALAEIPTRADDDERYAQEVILRATDRDPTRQFEPRLEAISKSAREKFALFDSQQLRRLPVIRLESLDRNWKFDARQFGRWRAELDQASNPYAQMAAQIAKRRADWEATRSTPGAAWMPAALAGSITSVLAELALADEAISAPLEKQVQLNRRANAVEARIQAGKREVAAAIDYSDSRLLHFDAPPLWALPQDLAMDKDMLASATAGLAIETRFLKQYNAANGGLQRLLGAFQWLLLPLLLWLFFRNRKMASDDPDLQASIRILRRPFSAWLLLSAMAVLAFKPDAPLILQQIVMLVALVPVLRLLPHKVYRILGPWPYVVSGLYLLMRLRFVFLTNAYHYRLYFLILALLALALTLWLLWRSRHRKAVGPDGRAYRFVRMAEWAAVAVLVLSILSNVAGNISLAEMMTNGLIKSGYAGLCLYAGVFVLTSLLGLLFTWPSLLRFRIVRRHAAPMLRSFTRLLDILALVSWVVFTMIQFRVFRPVYGAVTTVLTHSFSLGKLAITLGSILLFVLSVLVAYWAAKTVRFILQEEVLPGMSLPRGVDNSISSLSYYVLILLGLLMALAAAGFEVGQLAFAFGALGVGIGFGLQNVVNNFVSGLILMFERPVQPGDVVDIMGTSGKIREIGMRATTLTTFEGADVIVPNGTLLSEKLVNWTLRNTDRRIETELGVAYGSDPAQVRELLAEVTRSTPGLLDHPEPSVLFVGFGASSLDFSIRAWTHDFDNWVNIRSSLLTRIYEALNEAGIEIPFPQQDLYLRSIPADAGTAFATQPRPGQVQGADPAKPGVAREL